MRWPSRENGSYTFSVKIYEKSGTTWNDLTSALPGLSNSLTLRIDNTRHDAKILNIWQIGPPDSEVQPCEIVSSGKNRFYFRITAYDPSHHLLSYRLRALWGDNASELIFHDSYESHIDAEGPYLWSGVVNEMIPATWWTAHCDCAHTFYIRAWKRTINGYNYILRNHYHKSITINNTGVACP
jgi:hypothetical protein